MGFDATLNRLASEGSVVALHEDGDPATAVDPPADPVFVLSDHRDFTPEERDALAAAADHRLRLGPRTLHADHAITVAHHYCDTDGYTDF
jgi:tRNA (pseudouridine54-N1)-methyltransferase